MAPQRAASLGWGRMEIGGERNRTASVPIPHRVQFISITFKVVSYEYMMELALGELYTPRRPPPSQPRPHPPVPSHQLVTSSS